MLLRIVLVALIPSIFAAQGCRTNSEEKSSSSAILDDAELNVDSWTAACERSLKNPIDGAKSRTELHSLAGTEDCKAAYPAVREIMDQFHSTASKK